MDYYRHYTTLPSIPVALCVWTSMLLRVGRLQDGGGERAGRAVIILRGLASLCFLFPVDLGVTPDPKTHA